MLVGPDGEINFYLVGLCHAKAKLFGLAADIVVVNRKTGFENDFIDAVEGGTAEADFLGVGGKGGGGGEGGDAKEDVVVWIDILLEAELTAFEIPSFVGKIEVAAAGDLVGENFSTGETELGQDGVVEAFVENIVSVALDAVVRVFKVGPLGDFFRIVEIDEDSDSFPRGWIENGGEKAVELKGWEGACGGGHNFFNLRCLVFKQGRGRAKRFLP